MLTDFSLDKIQHDTGVAPKILIIDNRDSPATDLACKIIQASSPHYCSMFAISDYLSQQKKFEQCLPADCDVEHHIFNSFWATRFFSLNHKAPLEIDIGNKEIIVLDKYFPWTDHVSTALKLMLQSKKVMVIQQLRFCHESAHRIPRGFFDYVFLYKMPHYELLRVYENWLDETLSWNEFHGLYNAAISAAIVSTEDDSNCFVVDLRGQRNTCSVLRTQELLKDFPTRWNPNSYHVIIKHWLARYCTYLKEIQNMCVQYLPCCEMSDHVNSRLGKNEEILF